MKIDFLAGHVAGRSDFYAGRQCTNWMPVFIPPVEVERQAVVLYPTAGLELFAEVTGGTRVKGLLDIKGTTYVVVDNTFYTLGTDGTLTNKGTVTSSRSRVQIIPCGENQIAILGGTTGYYYNISTGVLAQITDGDFVGADYGVFFDGYLIVVYGNTFYWSALNDVSSWDGADLQRLNNDFKTLKTVGLLQDTIYFLAETQTEKWFNDGSTPFQRRTYDTEHYGICAPESLQQINTTLFWLARGKAGDLRVVSSSVRELQEMSTESINHQLSTLTSPETAFGLVFSEKNHLIYALTFPDDNLTLCFDTVTNLWHKRSSNIGTDYEGNPLYNCWRVNCVAKANNILLAGDYHSGKIYKIKTDVYTENSTPILRTFISGSINEESNWITISDFLLDMQPGSSPSGSSSESYISLHTSKDGGFTWGQPRIKSIGLNGRYKTQVKWKALGRSKNWRFKLETADPGELIIGSVAIHGTMATGAGGQAQQGGN